MKTLELGNGLKLTESEDMGVFLHFTSARGVSNGGRCLEPGTPGYVWAKELLEVVPEHDDPPWIKKSLEEDTD